MIAGQVPRKSRYSRVERARVLSVAIAACARAAFAVLMGAAVLRASDFTAAAAAQDTSQIVQDVVVPPVKRQRPADNTETSPKTSPETQTAPAQPDDDAEQPAQSEGGIFGAVQDWLARANREYQGIVVKELSSPQTVSPPATPGDDPIAKKLEEQQQEDARATAAKRLAEDRRRAEETKRLADEASRKADEVLKDVTPQPAESAEEQHREAQKLAEENRRQEEQRQADAQRRSEAELKRAAAAAEAARAEAARDDAARADAAIQEAEQERAREAQKQNHRRRTIQLTAEPIERPDLTSEREFSNARYAAYRAQSAAYRAQTAAYRPMAVVRPHAGTAVKHWVKRVEPRAHICRAAGRRVALPGRYTVKRGDSLWRISKRHYRKGKYYTRIYAANRSRIRNPELIYPCQRVLVPRKRR